MSKLTTRLQLPAWVGRLLLAGIDALAWTFGIFAVMTVRFDFSLAKWVAWRPEWAVLAAALLMAVSGTLFGLYGGRWRRGSLDEAIALLQATAVTGLLLMVVNGLAPGPRLVPVSVAVAAAPASLSVSGFGRLATRFARVRQSRQVRSGAVPVLVFGAGDGGHQVVTSMQDDVAARFVPLGIIDDDPDKNNLRLRGVPVMGDRSQLTAMVQKTGAEMLVVAAPSITSDSLRDLSARALEAQIPVRIVPPVAELIDGSVGADDVRPLTETDLLGRHQVDTDLSVIAGYITGRRVLVTGAGGSIGSELCLQLHRFGPSSLIMVDRDESALHGVQMAIEGRALLDDERLVVADIRDRRRMDEVFAMHRPHVVFHVAALKHLPLLELHPAEAVKTNIHGTLNVLEAAAQNGVQRFVNISTDKAADPTSVLGFTKRVGEQLTAWFAGNEQGEYLSVRFGNVLGSRGSVLGAFERQVAEGGPVTVTHPDVTRYFMTVTEAVELVVQAGAVGRDGEVLVLDMGQPVKIIDVARRLVAQADRPIDIVFTGLRPGEKLHEVLLGQGETDQRHVHPLISHCAVPAQPPSDLESLAVDDPDVLKAALAMLCLTELNHESAPDITTQG